METDLDHRSISKAELQATLERLTSALSEFSALTARFISVVANDERKSAAITPAEARVIDSFVAACVRPDHGARLQSATLYKAFRDWAMLHVQPLWTAKKFALMMKALGYTSLHSNVHWWLDVRLMSSPASATRRVRRRRSSNLQSQSSQPPILGRCGNAASD